MPPLADLLPSDPNYAACVAAIIRTLGVPAQAVTQANLLNAFFGANPVGVTVFDNASLPCVAARFGNTSHALYCFTGLKTVFGAQQLISSWIESANTANQNTKWVRIVQTTANQFETVPGLSYSLPSVQTHFAGHSFGGGIAMAMAARQKTIGANNPPLISTFGTPRLKNPSSAPGFGACPIVRWWNVADDVPSYPPPASQAPLIHAALGQAASFNALRWEHPSIAYVLGIAGGITTSFNGPPVGSVGLSTLQAAYSAQTGALGEAHQIDAYVDRLIASIPPPPLAVTVPPPPMPSTPVPNEQTSPAQQTVLNQTLIAFVNQTAQADSIAVVIPKPPRYTWYKSGKLWYVALYGSPIGVHTSKRKVMAIAHHGNVMLRLFQNVGQAFTADYIYALTKYLNDASLGGLGFVPPLNTGQVGAPPVPPPP